MTPNTLKNFNLFVDGRGYAGVVDEITPPKLSIKTDEHRAGGMDVPVELDMGMEAMTMDFTLSQYDADVLKNFGVNNGATLPMTMRGALQAEGGAVIPVIINARGMIKMVDDGTWKAGEKTQLKITAALRYYKRTIGGAVLHEIDVENMTRVINGVDQMADLRNAIGI